MALHRQMDGGYGWVVVVCSMFLEVLFSSSYTCFGVLFLPLVEYFEASKTSIAWIAAFKLGTMGIAGVVIGPLTKVYGCQKVVIVCSSMIFVAYTCCVFVNSVVLLYIFFGFIPGLGYGGYLVCAPVAVQQYFDKKRSLAVGLVMAGISFGSFSWPPFTAFLVNSLGWRGTILTLAALHLHGVLFGMLLRPLPPDVTVTPKEPDGSSHLSGTHDCLSTLDVDKSISETKYYAVQRSQEERKLSMDDSVEKLCVQASPDVSRPNGDLRTSASMDASLHSREIEISVLLERSSSDNKLTASSARRSPTGKKESPESDTKDSHEEMEMDVCDSLIQGNSGDKLAAVSSKSSQGLDRSMSEEDGCQSLIVSTPDFTGVNTGKSAGTMSELFKSLVDFRLFKTASFTVYFWGIYLQKIGVFLVFTFLPVRGIALGVTPQKASFLMSILGASSVLGRMTSGYFADKLGDQRVYWNGATAALGGLASALSVFCHSYGALAAYVVCYGLLSAVYVVLELTCIVDLWGRDVLARATGFFMVAVGLCNLTWTPISGYLMDLTGDPAIPFVVLGSTQVVGGLLMLTSALLERCHKPHDNS